MDPLVLAQLGDLAFAGLRAPGQERSGVLRGGAGLEQFQRLDRGRKKIGAPFQTDEGLRLDVQLVLAIERHVDGLAVVLEPEEPFLAGLGKAEQRIGDA